MAISCFTHLFSLTWLAPNSCMAHVQPGFTDTFAKNISGWKAVFDSDDPVHVPLLHKKSPKPLSHWIPMQYLQTANHQPQLSICINLQQGTMARQTSRKADSIATGFGSSCRSCWCDYTRQLCEGVEGKDYRQKVRHWPAGCSLETLLLDSMNFFISLCCLDSLGFLDNPWPGLQDIILAKLGADFLEPPPFNLEKVWQKEPKINCSKLICVRAALPNCTNIFKSIYLSSKKHWSQAWPLLEQATHVTGAFISEPLWGLQR